MRRFWVLILAALARAAVQNVVLNVSYVQNVNPDGLYPRRMIGVNGSWPPPPIIGNVGDTLMVTAINGLGDAGTSLHFHGNFFGGVPQYDGAVGVSQCAIPPGQNLTYEVPFKQGPGTYWYHGHYNGQYVDGLKAPYIIKGANESQIYGYDDEFIVILTDHYHQEHAALMSTFLSEANPTGAEPVPESGLIYFAHGDQYLPGFNENASLPFQPGKTYRLRIINMAALAMFHVWIDGHKMQIIEADGEPLQPAPVDIFSISVAQRYSVLVTALNDTSSNYVFHATQNGDMYDVVPPELVLNDTAVISYSSNNPAPVPQTIDDFGGEFNDTVLVPMTVQAMEPATWNITLTATFDTSDDGTPRAWFNDVSYNPANTPSLFTMLSMGNNSLNDAVYGPAGYIMPGKTIVEVTLINGDDGLHPFHLHGHKFQVVQKNENLTEADPPVVEGQTNPLRRDTVTVPGQGSVTLRFETDNPGAWLLHCHIDWHFSQGLAVVFLEDPAAAQQALTISPPMAEQCVANGYSATGNAAGFNSTTDFAGLTVGPYTQAHILGWTPKAKGALAGCVMAALLGILTIIWYSFLGNDISDEEHEEEVREARAAKAAAGGGLLKRSWKVVRRDRPAAATTM